MALITLKEKYEKEGEQSIIDLFRNYTIVSEQIDGSRFLFQRQSNGNIVFYRRVGVPINYIDRTMAVFYEKAIKYIEKLPDSVISDIPDNWTFGFRYFPSNRPVKITYEKLPKNNLILTDISIRNESGRVVKVINDVDILEKWAKKLDVELPPIIYKGKLNDRQVSKIIEYIKMEDSEALESFENEEGFTTHMLDILNPALKSTSLSYTLKSKIEGISFKVIETGSKNADSYKITNPYVIYEIQEEDRKPSDLYQIAILDFLEFIKLNNIKQFKLSSNTPDEKYIELLSLIFNRYISENGHKYVGVEFEIPEFAKREEYSLNINMIKNDTTKKIVHNYYIGVLFKMIISTFRKSRKTSNSIITDNLLRDINLVVDEIEELISGEIEESENDDILDFDEFLSSISGGSISHSLDSVALYEALVLTKYEQGKNPCNIFVGRFQPFTLGHVKVFEQLHKVNGYPVNVFIIRGKNTKPEKKPLERILQIKMFEAMKKQYRFLGDIYFLPTAGIDRIFEELRPKYEPVLWGTGTDRVKGYDYQIQRYSEEINAREDFKIHEIHRTDSHISATKVREAVLDDNVKEFEKMTPKSIHKFYTEIKSQLDAVYLNEKKRINEAIVDLKIGDEILGKVDTDDKKTINIIKRIVTSSLGRDDLIKNLVNSNIPEKQANKILNILSKGNWEKVHKYLSNKTLEINDILGKKINTHDINRELFDINDISTSKEFIEFSWASVPSIGKGEVWLATVIDNAKMGKIGDVDINGKELEVKGESARLAGQSGYGDAKQMRNSLSNAIHIIANKLNIKNYSIIDTGKNNDWNINKRSGNLLVENLKSILENSKLTKFTKKEISIISTEVLNAYNILLLKYDFRKKYKVFEKAFLENGDIDLDYFHNEMFKVFYEYYQEIEKFEYFAVFNNSGVLLTIKQGDFNKHFDSGNFRISSVPSFGDSAGKQGGIYAISLR